MKSKKVAYLGIPGSFSHSAAAFYFMKNVQLQSQQTVEAVLRQVQQNVADFAVVPIENSSTGSIMETYDQLLNMHLVIEGELTLRIHHHVAGYANGLQDVKRCYSHQVVFDQCKKFFHKHISIEKIYTTDTATAAKLVSQRKDNCEVAITSLQAIRLYKLPLITENIEDYSNNYTRFVVAGKRGNPAGDKFSLALSVKHEPGSLVRILKPLSDLGMNLTKIESRPLFGIVWEYIFFLDFDSQGDKKAAGKAIKMMKENVEFLTVLGQYAKGEIYES